MDLRKQQQERLNDILRRYVEATDSALSDVNFATIVFARFIIDRVNKQLVDPAE